MDTEPKSKKMIYLKIAMDYGIALLTLLFIVVCIPKIIVFFLPFVIGYVISIIANPIVKFLEKKLNIVRKHGSAIIIVSVILLVCFAIYWIFSIIIGQAIGLIDDMPQTLVSMKEQINEIINKFYHIYEKLPDFAKNYLSKIKEGFSNSGLEDGSLLSISGASTAVKSVAEVLLSIIFTILSAYFFTAEKENLGDNIDKILPQIWRDKVKMISSYFTTAVGGYFVAQFKIMIILVAIMFITFEFMDVNYSFLISLGIGLLDFLPVFGTGAVLWPWAAYTIIVGEYSRGITLVVLYVVCQLVKQFLQPKVVGDSIGISSLTTLFLLFIGYKIGGLVGILIALPLGMVVINLYRAGTFDVLIEDAKFLYTDINEFRTKYTIKRK